MSSAALRSTLAPFTRYSLLAATALCLTASPLLAQTEVTVHADRTFPESITSTPDGSIIVGSTTKAMVLRSAPGAATAEPWIATGTNGLQRVLGVLADPHANTLWVCSSKKGPNGDPTALKSFDLQSGAPKGSFTFPENEGLCNDIAIRKDGTAYVTDTTGGRILRLKRGASAFETWIKDPELASADGIGFGDNNTLFVNTFSTGHLVRIRILKDGAAGHAEPLKTSLPLTHPDGIRPLNKKAFLMVEGAGRLDKVTVSGDTATIQVLKDGFIAPTAVTIVKHTAWVLEGKPGPNDPAKDPGPSLLRPVPLGK